MMDIGQRESSHLCNMRFVIDTQLLNNNNINSNSGVIAFEWRELKIASC